ncbi:hypothetical protein NL108_003106 [Boleophthalmus pectinirostris]|nr:hypothetical protein NL108_003106 [Boleophthalmus pectinirostris]
MMSHLSVTCVFVLLSLISSVTLNPVRNEEQDSFQTELRRPWSVEDTEDSVLEDKLRQWLSSGLDRRRQLGDIEFSNRYSEFLRSKAKHTSMCAFLRRMQGVKKSGVGADTERVNLLLKQYMCPSILPWPADL